MSSRGTGSGKNGGVFVIIKGEKCGYCKRLAPQLPEIERLVKQEGVQYIDYEVAEMWKAPNGPKGMYPPVIGFEGIWYPFIFYVSDEVWTGLKAGKDLRSEMKILNGIFNGRGYSLVKQTYNPLIPGHVISWLKEVTSKTTIVNGMVVPGSVASLGSSSTSNPPNRSAPNVPNRPSPGSPSKPNSGAKHRPVAADSKNDLKMTLVPRRKYGKHSVNEVLNKLYD